MGFLRVRVQLSLIYGCFCGRFGSEMFLLGSPWGQLALIYGVFLWGKRRKFPFGGQHTFQPPPAVVPVSTDLHCFLHQALRCSTFYGLNPQ